MRENPGRKDQGGETRKQGPGRKKALATGGQVLQGHFGVTVTSDIIVTKLKGVRSSLFLLVF